MAIALALPISMLLGGAAASGPLRAATITEIKVRAAELPARIHSYEFVATTTETRSGNSLVTKSHVWQSGDYE